MAKQNESFMDRAMNEWWGKVVCGLLIVSFAAFFFYRVNRLENGELESLRVSAMEKILYDLGGKWAVTGIVGTFGAAITAWGVAQLVQSKLKKPD